MTYRRGCLFVLLALFASAAPAVAQSNVVSLPTALRVLNDCAILPTANMGTGAWEVSGTFSGTVSFTVSVSGDVGTYQPVNVNAPGSTTQVTSTTSAGSWGGTVAAYRYMRACLTAGTGTATVFMSAAATGGAGGGGGGTFSGTVSAATTTDPDDASIAAAQTNDNVNSLNMAFDGTVWRRLSFGTAGTASAQVWTVQGIASMTALKVDGSAVTQPISASSLPLATGAATAAKQPALGTAGSASTDVITVQGIASGTAQPVSNAGTFPVQADVTKVLGSTLSASNPVFTQLVSAGSAVPLATGGAGAVDSNTTRVVVATDQTGIPLGSTAVTTYSTTECVIVSAATTNATSCKASAGNFYGIEIYNTTTTVYWLRLYNLATAPTCSSATGFVRSIPIPPAAASGQAGGIVRIAPIGVGYSTGISYCLTLNAASTDNNAAAVGVYGALLYK